MHMQHKVRSRDKVIDLTQPGPSLTPTIFIPQPREETWYEFENRESIEIASALLYALPFAFLIDIIFVYIFWKAIHLF